MIADKGPDSQIRRFARIIDCPSATPPHLKNVLVVTYSQTGQLADAVREITGPLAAAGHRVHVEVLAPRTPFPWPWPIVDFVDVFPECVQLDPPPLAPLGVDPEAPFDLVILGYQVWYLSPSLPVTAFLRSPEAVRLLRGRPVVTVVAVSRVPVCGVSFGSSGSSAPRQAGGGRQIPPSLML